MEKQEGKKGTGKRIMACRLLALLLGLALQMAFAAGVRADGTAIGFEENSVGRTEAVITVKVLSGTDAYAYALCQEAAAERTASEVRALAEKAEANAAAGTSFAGGAGKLSFAGLLSGQYYSYFAA